MYTMELLDDEEGGAQAAINDFRVKRGMKQLRMMFKTMVNSAYNFLEQKESCTGKEIMHADMVEVKDISEAINVEMQRSLHIETALGNEGDEDHHDAYLEEIAAEESKNVETGKG
jgi:hypothetical protein